MNVNPTTAALSVALAVTLAAGCNRDVAEGGIAPGTAPAVGIEATRQAIPRDELGNAPVGGPAVAVGAAGIETWDVNSDGSLDNEEFRTRFNDGDWYGDWDTDRSGGISEEEFTRASANWRQVPEGVDRDGLFSAWDTNDDGMLDNDELVTGIFSTLDRDRNTMLDTGEYDAGRNWLGW
ncbi:MAG: hypothetical protein M3Q40_01680 [Pseudomonadota bacterium]|nr:hypothetical protein [Pseudomonadota bacterium]